MSRASSNLADLMAAAQRGDAEAYRRLLTAAHESVLGFFRKRLSDGPTVEDLAQDVLLKIHVYRDTFDPSRSFEAWMFAIASRTLIDHFRARGVRARFTELEDDMDAAYGAAGDAEAALALKQAVGAMTPAQVEAFERVKLDGEEIAAVASTTATTIGSTKVRVHRAARAFLAAFHADEPDEDPNAPDPSTPRADQRRRRRR